MNTSIRKVIILPVTVAIGIIAYLIIRFALQNEALADWVGLATICVGAAKFVYETVRSALRRKFGLDYIAIAAILTAVYMQDYLVGTVIVLMLTTGDALEAYASLRARKSLTSLIDRIPKDVSVVGADGQYVSRTIESIQVGEQIVVRRGEVIPLDGVLQSEVGQADESSLTGEPYFMEKRKGDIVRSGTVNVGDVLVIEVTTVDNDSTYRKIIQLVQQAQETNAPLVRLADRYSAVFTIITAVMCAFAYLLSRDLETVLAVLVVATPCPLLLATPIALIGGMSASAREKIILKDLASIEVLARTNAIVFDKTGTITLGELSVTNVDVQESGWTEEKVLAVSSAIEHNSLHPIAKAIVHHAREQNVPLLIAENSAEIIGTGIEGEVEGDRFRIAKVPDSDHFVIRLSRVEEGRVTTTVADISLADQIKADTKVSVHELEEKGFAMYMLTGDKQAVAEKIAAEMDSGMHVQGNATPEQKMQRIEQLKAESRTVAMVGDGINDAPALATADVGIVFANEQHTAASEAADIVLLGGDFSQVLSVFRIARRTIRIALQSIWVGIGLSVACMFFAALGFIPPIIGSLLQEGIDILVIINALRASRAV